MPKVNLQELCAHGPAPNNTPAPRFRETAPLGGICFHSLGRGVCPWDAPGSPCLLCLDSAPCAFPFLIVMVSFHCNEPLLGGGQLVRESL